MEIMTHTSMWIDLITLILLEIILGIDNIIFITILSEKLPKKNRKTVKTIGLILALIIRVGLLSLTSWIITFKTNFAKIGPISFSIRDIIFLVGGIFLVLKTTIELHEKLENKKHNTIFDNHDNFWIIIIQIAILDAIFSLDAIITAIGIVNNNSLLIILSVIISVFIMLFASQKLSQFINNHQTIVILCLSFLLMVGINLIAEGLGFYISKSYLYVSIGFSILIELFNYIAKKNLLKQQSKKSIRERTAEILLKLISGKIKNNIQYKKKNSPKEIFEMKENKYFLTIKKLYKIMTPRDKIVWINYNYPIKKLKKTLIENSYNSFPICEGKIDNLVGIIHTKDILSFLESNECTNTKKFKINSPTILIQDNLDILKLLKELQKSKGNMVIITNNNSIVQGLLTPVDILKAITNNFQD